MMRHSLFQKQTPTTECCLEISCTRHKVKALFLGMPFKKTLLYTKKDFYHSYDSKRRAVVNRRPGISGFVTFASMRFISISFIS